MQLRPTGWRTRRRPGLQTQMREDLLCISAGLLGCREPHFRNSGRPARLTSLYRNRIAALANELARDDPLLVEEVIARLRQSGEIERNDLVYLDRIADRWIRIAEENRLKARPRWRLPAPAQAVGVS